MILKSVQATHPLVAQDRFSNKTVQKTSSVPEVQIALGSLSQETSQAKHQPTKPATQKPIKLITETPHSRMKKIGWIAGSLLLGAGVCLIASQSLWPSLPLPPTQDVTTPSPNLSGLNPAEPIIPMANEVPDYAQVFKTRDYRVLNEDTGTTGVSASLYISKLPLEYRCLKSSMARLEAFYQEKNITDLEPLVYTNDNANNLRKLLIKYGVVLTTKTSLWEQWNGSPKEVDNGVFEKNLKEVQEWIGIFNKVIQDNAQEPSHIKEIDRHLADVDSLHSAIRKVAARRAVRLPFHGNKIDTHIKHHLIRERFVLPETDSMTTANMGWGNTANGGNYWIQC